MEKEQAIQYIQQQIDKIDIDKFTVGDDSHIYLEEWQDSTLDILKAFLDKSQVMQFRRDMWHQSNYMNTNNIEYKTECIKKLKLKLNRYINNIDFSFNTKISKSEILSSIPDKNGIVIHNNNITNQTQEVNTNIIVQNIFEGLDDSEKEALKKILQQYNKDQDKNNLIQALQSMGQGVLENILANIITNPIIFDQLLSKL